MTMTLNDDRHELIERLAGWGPHLDHGTPDLLGDAYRPRPDLADASRALLYQFGVGLAFLSTVRPDGGPRVHPVWHTKYPCPVHAVPASRNAREERLMAEYRCERGHTFDVWQRPWPKGDSYWWHPDANGSFDPDILRYQAAIQGASGAPNDRARASAATWGHPPGRRRGLGARSSDTGAPADLRSRVGTSRSGACRGPRRILV
jgi:hypothetical protein